MIVVLDTNVIISALLSASGAPAEIINHWQAGEFNNATSKLLIKELENGLTYPKVVEYLKASVNDTLSFLRYFRQFSEVVEPDFSLNIIRDDPDDNRVLECAIAANVAYIISGDKHLLALEEFRGVVILTPTNFNSFLKTQKA
jgi:putative PIN family toxin of toxin-antitoxin system